ncbi:MAG TPA: NAD(P)-binding domain-containing protein [Methylophilaceae bacterium]
MTEKRKAISVCIVGAGVGGLAIAKQLQDSGINFQCFDARGKLGGIWSFTEDANFTAAWARLNQNTPRGRYEFSDYPMPASYPDYPTREQVQNYLEDYARHFNFIDKIQLNTLVLSADRQPNGGWMIETSDNQKHYFDYFVVANGHHNKPNYPAYVKDNKFNGTSLHSSQYRHREVFQGKKVMVVGIGNSGSQIAVDVSHAAEQTFISTRRGVYILPHYICGLRFDNLFGFVEWWWVHKLLPWPVLHWISSGFYKLFLAKNTQFGLPTPDHKMFEALPTLSENFFNRIGDGRLVVKPEVAHIDGDTVHFKDGSSEKMDAIIYSTGFDLDFPFFKAESLKLHENRVPLFKRIFSPQYPDVCFIGLFQAVTFGFLHMMEHQARLVARYIDGKYTLPSHADMLKDIQRERKHIERTFAKVLRNNYQMMGSVYVHEVETELKKGMKRTKSTRKGTSDMSVAFHPNEKLDSVA